MYSSERYIGIIAFDNNTKHVISWKVQDDAFDQVNITLVNKNDNNNVVNIGVFGK